MNMRLRDPSNAPKGALMLSLHRITSLSLILFASLGTIAACSSDSEEPGPVNVTPSGTRIAAATGGTVSDADGIVTLTIPKGALAEDTDISLAVSPASAETVSGIFDFGPDGLTFLAKATLSVKVDAASIADKDVAIALETNGKFVPLEGSTYANGVVTAPIEHFSKFSVVYLEGKAVKTACDEAVEAFEACGGDLLGTWTIDAFCVAEVSDIPGDPCPERKLDVAIDPRNLSFTFGDDGVFEHSDGYFIFTMTSTLPLSCFEGESSCEAASGLCKGDAVCTCTEVESDIYRAAEGTYATDGSTVTTELPDDEGGTDVVSYEYCVKEGTLYLLDKGVKGAGAALWTLKKN